MMPLAPGVRVGVYEVLGLIGAGGMGEVYRARDTKLDRDVAIKILPELFAHDPERRARFEREAKTLASDGSAGAAASQSPTITSPAGVTGVGVLLGTAAYMSPEQAKGKPADKRADIWAFGCVLYEMVAGTRAFAGDDVSDTLASVLRAEPEWSALPAETPDAVRRLLRRSLEKDRHCRLSDIADARLEIDEALTMPAAPRGEPALAQAVVPTRPFWRRAMPILATAIAGGAIAGATSLSRAPPAFDGLRTSRLDASSRHAEAFGGGARPSGLPRGSPRTVMSP